FGHGKAEFMAARTVAVMLILIAVVLGYQAIDKILKPPPESFPKTFTLWFVLASILIKEGMYQYKYRLARRLKSESLLADAWHHRSDAFSSVCALAGISAALVLGHEWQILDPIAALSIVLIILGVGIKAFFRAGSALMDEAADAETLGAIRRVAAGVAGVKDTEKLMTRRSGLETHMELHVEVDPAMSVRDAHAVAQQVEQTIRREVPGATHVTVHIEPYYPDDH
ncbi:MAG TPA: cation diffusion facilitator family transporter, partial [Phycisphaerae bacterium]|nr:cation diffusion facilitator family transporter [Phycisphaerae bacterium]